jgi:hypothetical protein
MIDTEDTSLYRTIINAMVHSVSFWALFHLELNRISRSTLTLVKDDMLEAFYITACLIFPSTAASSKALDICSPG